MSRVPAWAYIFAVSVILFLIIVRSTRKQVDAPAWPYCAQCAKRFRVGSFGGWGLALVGFIAFLAGAASNSEAGAMISLFAFILFLGGLFWAAFSSRVALAGGAVLRDGSAVEFKRAAPAFAAQAAAAQQAAAQHFAAQQQAYTAQYGGGQPYPATPQVPPAYPQNQNPYPQNQNPYA